MIIDIKKLDKIAKQVSIKLAPPVVVLLHGDLGTGKTTLVKKIIKNYKIKQTVFSPTFLIRKSYKLKNIDLVHYDLYRINHFRELIEIGFEEDIHNPRAIIFIEWPEKVKYLATKIKKINNKLKIIKILLHHTNDIKKRKIDIKYE